MRVFEVEFNCTKQSYTVTIEYFSQSLNLGQQYPKSFIETTIQELSRSKKLYTTICSAIKDVSAVRNT